MTVYDNLLRDRNGNPLHPFCKSCGWRKGGIDSWDGKRCKCGHAELPMRELTVAEFPVERSKALQDGLDSLSKTPSWENK